MNLSYWEQTEMLDYDLVVVGGVGLLFFYEINKKMEDQIELELKQRRNN